MNKEHLVLLNSYFFETLAILYYIIIHENIKFHSSLHNVYNNEIIVTKVIYF